MGGWLAGLDAFVVGLAYLGALLASRFVVRPLLAATLGNAPVIGGWITSNLDGGFAAFERAITPAANASMGTLISAWDWATQQVRGVLGGVADLAESVYARLYHLATVTVPQAVGVSVQWIEGLVEDAKGWALLRIQDAEVRLRGEVALVEGEASQLVAEARREALDEVQAAEHVVLQEIRKAEQAAGDLFLQAEHEAGLLVAESEAKVVELVRIARADLSAAVGAVEHDLQKLAEAERVALADSVSLLGGDLAAAEARATQAISGLEASTQKSLEGILGGVPWQSLAAAVGAGEAVLQADVRTLVGATLAELRKLFADAEALRAKYGPEVAAALQQLKV